MPQYSSDLRVRCRRFAADIVSMCNTLSEKPSTRTIVNQIIRSAASIGANIEEAKGSGTRVEFTRFFRIALKSANETKYWLELIQDIGLAPAARLAPAMDETTQIIKMLAASILKLQQKTESF